MSLKKMNSQHENSPIERVAKFEIDLRSGLVIGKDQENTSEEVEKIYKVIIDKIYTSFSSSKSGILQELNQKISSGNNVEAFLFLEEAYDKGKLTLIRNQDILLKICEININTLSEEQVFKLFKIKFYLASKLRNFSLFEQDAKIFLKKYNRDIDKDLYDGVILVRANGAAQKGNKELAYRLYQQLLEFKESITIDTYAWACRGMAITLDPHDPESYKYHEMAVDSFLQCGQRLEAAKSLYAMANFLENNNYVEALNLLKEAHKLLNLDSLNHQRIKASIYHRTARFLSKLKNYEEAKNEVNKAIELYRGLIGCEDELFSSLALASETYQSLNQLEQVENINHEKDLLKPHLRDETFKLQVRLSELISSNNPKEIEDFIHEVENNADEYLKILFYLANANYNPTLDNNDKLEELEKAITILRKTNFSNELWAIVCSSFASIYANLNLDNKAIEWHYKTLNYDPLNFVAIQNLRALLWKNEKWEEASNLFEQQRTRFGDKSFLLYCHGYSLLKAGNPKKAHTILVKAYKLDQRDEIKELLHKASIEIDEFDQEPSSIYTKDNVIVTRKSFEDCLKSFSNFIQSEKRMTFWNYNKDKKNHQWITKPENYAQNLLHTFIKGYFEEQVDIFEEVDAGAGRIDIFLKFSNVFSTVIELKMCGDNYTKNYAEKGLEQLHHYLTNKHTSLGYLIIFDGRIRDFGKGFSEIYTYERHTIFAIPVDVRPKVN